MAVPTPNPGDATNSVARLIPTRDHLTTPTAIAAIAAILCFCIHHGINHTLVKIGIAAIAGLGGFGLRGLFTKP